MPRLAGLAPSPSNGYHSSIHPRPEATAWVQVDLGRSVPIEEIRLVPARPVDFPDTPGFGFPHRFRVEVSDEPQFAPRRAKSIVEEDRLDGETVEDEPYLVSADGRTARYVRVTASRLWKRTGDYVFALAELEVISAGKNVARQKSVTSLDSIEGGLWGRAGWSTASTAGTPGPVRLTRWPRLVTSCWRGSRSYAGPAAGWPTTWSTRRSAPTARRPAPRLPSSTRASRPCRPVRWCTPCSRTRLGRSPSLRRGEVEQPGEPVGPGALSCVPGLDPIFSSSESGDEGARRAALAEWIASPANMLTWRSIANRVWHYHFGRGLVDTPNDFGRNGSKPTHPELLDWLAVELRDGGESLKALHRSIVTSAVYRQSSRDDAASARLDADNRWLWRMNRQRLDAEELRDSVLAVSGTLDPTMGGPGFALFRFKDDHSPIYDHTAPGALDNPGARRRTVYRFVVRSVPNPFLECLDGADPNINMPVRSTTITALQALALLNDAFMVRQSRAFARRLEALADDPEEQVEAAFVLALGRPPRPAERDALAAYARKHGLANACRLLFNTNEFLFID